MSKQMPPPKLKWFRKFLSARIVLLPVLVLAVFHGNPVLAQTLAGFPSAHALTLPSTHAIADFCLLTPRELCFAKPSVSPEPSHETASTRDSKSLLHRFAKDQIGIYSAPFHSSNLKWDALFLAGTGIFIATDKHATGAISSDNINISRHISDTGFYGTSAVAGIVWISGMATHNDHARETGFLSAEALANAFPLYVVMRYSLGRQRPNEGNGRGQFFHNNAYGSSFPSGHALFTWTMASVIAHEYPRPWVKWLAYSTAAAVSVARFTGREHFPADVFVGSVFGYLIGRHIFNAHCREGLSEGCHNHEVLDSN
jgi:membrane-associated phospholipid phosphatase